MIRWCSVCARTWAPSCAGPDVLAKRDARRRAREAVGRLSASDTDEFGDRIAARIVALPSFAAARTVLLYSALPDEVPTAALMKRAFEDDKRLALPRVSADAEGLFEAVLCADLDQLAVGAFGLLEPDPASPSLSPHEIDLVIVPGRAFDRRGGRVGRGKGYYDRFLPRLRTDAEVVGVAFACQIFDDQLEGGPHDVRVRTVVTETEVFVTDTTN